MHSSLKEDGHLSCTTVVLMLTPVTFIGLVVLTRQYDAALSVEHVALAFVAQWLASGFLTWLFVKFIRICHRAWRPWESDSRLSIALLIRLRIFRRRPKA